MRSNLLTALVVFTLLFVSSSVLAQTVIVLRPAPRVVYSPVVTAYSPVLIPSVPVVASYAPTIVAPPVVTYYQAAPADYETIVTPAPTIVGYAPAVPSYAVPVVVGRPDIIVRPKVYVRGQPVRNIFRAITP